MKFDMNQFALNLEEHNSNKKSTIEQSGLVNVIRYLYNNDYVYEIDFDTFDINDVFNALDSMECIALSEENDEIFIADPNNPFMIFNTLDNALYQLAISKNKSYEQDINEEFFI